MKLDASALRYLPREDFRILSAVRPIAVCSPCQIEIGSKNHEVVPLTMIASLCRMRPGGVNSRLSELAKHRLASKEHHTSYEGFRLTYGGYDYLALHALSLRCTVENVGRQIGVGKESDVYLVSGRRAPVPADGEGDAPGDGEAPPLEAFVLKIARLGRTSFRTIKSNRDYVGRRKHVSWMYMSRLAAEKEWAFLSALYKHGFPTPVPVDWSRHCIVMEYIHGRPLDQLHPEDWQAESRDHLLNIAQFLYSVLMRLLVRLGEHGLIHGDFNEFNIMVKEEFVDDPEKYMRDDEDERDAASTDALSRARSPVIMIDFPQMVSTAHTNAQELFERDVNCLRVFFSRRFGFEPSEWPSFTADIARSADGALDTELKASGFRGRSSSEAPDSDPDSDSDLGSGSEADSGAHTAESGAESQSESEPESESDGGASASQ